MAKSTGGSEDDNTSVLMAAYEARGQACRQLGKWHDAANDFLGAINSGSVAWTLHWWRAFSLVRSGQIPEAEKSLANCEKFARDQTQPSLFWRILYQIALIYLGLAWTEEGADCVYEASAARYLQAAAEMPALSDIVPGSADGKVMAALKYQHGVQMARVCSFAEAAEHLEQAEQMMGQFESRDIRLQCGILLERGTAYIMCDRHLDAVRDFSSVLKLDESNIRAFHG
jgi:tetratricopeptide (TPR) repeat protein